MIRVFITCVFCVLLQFAVQGQTYKVLISEDFGTGSADPSTTPASNIAPGTSSYTTQTSKGTLPDGSYAVAKNPQGYDDFGNITSAWQHGGDHTTGTGYMMLINANPLKQGEANGAYYLYSSSVFDIPGATYVIDFWGANVIRYNMTTSYPSLTFKDARIGLSVRNTPNATGTLYNTSGTNQWVLPRATGSQNNMPWVNRSVTFTLPTSYNAAALYFNFYNTDTDPSTFGNDLAIDDITIKMQVVSLSGTVFNDANGNTVINAGEPGINGLTAPMYAYLTKSNGTIISKVQVQADGSYVFSGDQGVPYTTSNIGLKVSISTQNLSIGSTLTTPAFPAGYVPTGENVNGATATAGVADGTIMLTASATDMANLNFGIERLPVPVSATTTIPQPGPGKLITLNGVGGNPPVPYATDAEDTILSTNRTIVINTVPSNTTLLYNNAVVTPGQSIPSFNPALLVVKITSAAAGTTSTSFTFNYQDGAGKIGTTPATYTLQWSLPLPVRLVDFAANKEGQKARLTWTTASEENSQGFGIERSNDGVHWTEVLFVPSKAANGSSTTQLDYTVYDNQPMDGINYYRLQSLDKDGLATFSGVRSLNFEQTQIVSVYPNPVTDKLLIRTGDVAAVKEAHISDLQGRIVYRTNTIAEGIDVKALPPSTYVLQVEWSNGQTASFRIVKQ